MKLLTLFLFALLIAVGAAFWQFRSLPESDQEAAVIKATGAVLRLMSGDPVDRELERLRKLPAEGLVRQALLSYESSRDPAVGRLLLAFACDQDSFSPALRVLSLEILASNPDPDLATELAQVLPEEPDPVVRGAFARALLRCGPEGRGRGLQLLKHPDAGTRETVATAYGAVALYDGAENLLPLLEDPVPSVRVAVSLALARLGNPSGLPMLQSRLNAPEFGPSERLAIVQAFRDLGDPLLVPTLAAIAENPEQPDEVRSGAVRALGYIRDPSSLQSLLGWIGADAGNSHMGKLLPEIGLSLAELGHPSAFGVVIESGLSVRDPEGEKRLRAVLQGCSPAPRSFLPLLRSAALRTVTPTQRSFFSGLPEIVEGIRLYPIDRDGDRRSDLVLEITPGPPPAVLLAILEDPQVPWKEKDDASRMLRGYSDPAGYRPLLPRLLELIETCDDRTRFWVVRMLGATRDLTALSALIRAAEGEWTRPVTGAVSAIANLKSGPALDALLDLANRRPDDRDDVARVLDGFPLPRSMEFLEKLLEDEDERVQEAARRVIERLHRDGYLPDPEAALSSSDVTERCRAALALLLDRPTREDARAVLRDCLGGGSYAAESKALRGLRELGDPQLLPRLIELLRENRLDIGNLAQAYEVLGESGTGDAVSLLLRGMHEASLDSAREAARIALVRLGEDSSRDDLLAYYRSVDLPLPTSARHRPDFKAFLANPNPVNRGILLDLLGSNNADARYFASTALRHLGSMVREDLAAATGVEDRSQSREASWLLAILDARP